MLDHGIVYRNEDSYCGPISMLAKLACGDLVLVFREAKWRGMRTHADPTTRMSLLRSDDNGLTWTSHVTPDPAGGNGCAVARLGDGTLLANAFHWLFLPETAGGELPGWPFPGKAKFQGHNVRGGGVFTTRSTTDGYTWEPMCRIAEPPGWPRIVSHGQALELPDGELLLPVTASRGPEAQTHGAVLRSKDRGGTWGEIAVMTEDAEGVTFHETRLALCPSGRIVAMHRTPDGNYWRNFSTDDGRTWGESVATSIWCGGSSPPDLRVLSDGRLLLARGYRREPFGVRAYLSTDEGETWNAAGEIVLRDDGPDRDVGYPSTAQLDEGRLITVYYWHTEDEIRHLQRTIWEVPG